MTFDQAAARILLSNAPQAQKDRAFSALLRQSRIESGEQCPECDSTDILWNGHTGRDAGYRCAACDHHFGPDNEA